LNQPPIQFPLHLESLVHNVYSNTSSSRIGDEDKDIEVGMDDFLWDTHAIEGMFLNASQQDELGNVNALITNTFFESPKPASTTPLLLGPRYDHFYDGCYTFLTHVYMFCTF
jgi:hypothetical protein